MNIKGMIMLSYRFENKKFVSAPESEATLHCFSFAELDLHQTAHSFGIQDATNVQKQDLHKHLQKYLEKESHFLFLADTVLSAKNDMLIGHYADYTLLSLQLKNHEDSSKNEPIVMVFYKDYTLLFYDEKLATAESYIQHMNNTFGQLSTIDDPTLLIPYALIRYDLLTDRHFLKEIENEAMELELSVTTELKQAQNTILELRKILSNYKHYYLSLIDLFEDMSEDYKDLLSESAIDDYRRLTSKLNRLYKYTILLNEYVFQVNDRFRAQMDLNLNKTMRTFTILSAIFMPLTLIAGWYGMNFENMPELALEYGYIYVIAFSLMIFIGSLVYIKVKGFWK